MNKKTIIQLVIIICAFGGAGLVLYNGFFKNSTPSMISQIAPGQTIQTPQTILPNGDALDFSILHSRKFDFDQIKYPVLSTTEVGKLPVDTLILSPITNSVEGQ